MPMCSRLLLFLLCISLVSANCAFSQSNFWTQLNGPESAYLQAIAIAKDDTVITAGRRSGAFRSSDGGATWMAAESGLTMGTTWVTSNMAIHPATGDVYVGNGCQVYRSADSGRNWSPIGPPVGCEPKAIVFKPNGTMFVGGSAYGQVYRTGDDGVNWTPLPIGNANTDVTALALHPDGRLFAATNDGVYVSGGDGETWAAGGLQGIELHRIGVNVNGDVYASSFYDVYRSAGDLSKWAQVMYDADLKALGFNQQGHVFVGVVQGGRGVWRSKDNGKTWEFVGLGGRGVWAFAFGPEPGSIFAATGGDAVYHSSDNGDTWTRLASGMRGADVAALAFTPTGDLFASVFFDGVYRSPDRGRT